MDISPQSALLDTSCAILPYPTVVYRWLPGTPLGSLPTRGELASLLDTYRLLHRLGRAGSEEAVPWEAIFHRFSFEPYLAGLHDFLDEYGGWLAGTGPWGRDVRERLALLVGGCTEALTSTDVDPGRGSFPLRLCRVDPNLANAIWGPDDRLRWVDWEYGGWGDPALDLAELRWHASYARLGSELHTWLRDGYPRPVEDASFEARLALWDRLLSTRWPFLALRSLWSLDHGPDRLRLTRPERGSRDQVRVRLVKFVARAEGFAASQDRLAR